MMSDQDAEHLRKREVAEWVAAGNAACMARTAHEDVAESYAERAAAIECASREEQERLPALLDRLDRESARLMTAWTDRQHIAPVARSVVWA